MKKLVLIFCFNLLASVCMSQQYDVGIYAGVFSPTSVGNYTDGTLGPSYGIKFDYHFNDKFALSSNYMFGRFNHTSDRNSLKIREKVNLFYLTFQKKFPLKNGWLLAVGTGIGYYLEYSSDEIDPITQITEFYRDFAMPVELNFNKNIGKNLYAGIKSGFFLTPFYDIGSFHLGPEIRYRF